MPTRTLPAALVKRAQKNAALAAARHVEEARDLISTVLEKKRMVSDAFWDIGAALAKLKEDRYFRALGHTSFSGLLQEELSLSLTHANKLISVSLSFPRSDALSLGQERAAAVVELAGVRNELPMQLMRGTVALSGHHDRVRLTELSARAIQRAAQVERREHAGRSGRTASSRESAKVAASLKRALRAAGLNETKVSEVRVRRRGEKELSGLKVQFALGEMIAVGKVLAKGVKLGVRNRPIDRSKGVETRSCSIRIYLGDTGWDGTTSIDMTDWTQFGFNLDGKHFSSVDQAGYHCRPATGADPASVILDGPCGVDNSAGKNVLPILQAFLDTPSDMFSTMMRNGSASALFQFARLGASDNDSDIAVQVFPSAGSSPSGDPTMAPVPPTDAQRADGTYVWHPYAEGLQDPSVTDPALYQSKSQFPHGYLNGNVWVSGDAIDLVLQLHVPSTESESPTVIIVTVHHAVIQLQLSADHRSGSRGIIAGVINAGELATEIQNVANAAPPTAFCPPPSVDNIVLQILATADMGTDESQHPDQTCDAISVGFGFETTAAVLGVPMAPVVVTPSVCGGG